jgi:hypothetical protein
MNAQKKEAPRCQPESPGKEVEFSQPQNNQPESRKQEALQNLERFTDQLTVMAHWFEQLKDELRDVNVFLDPERFESLTRRIGLFCNTADSLCDDLGRRK